ncbi:MAG: HAD family hydrolase [Pirellulales bacterium]|nr:HAD family hydrolase [Pirellulales bacterium]
MESCGAIIFDLDDTLCPERQYVQSGMRAVAVWIHAKFGLPVESSVRELLTFVGSGSRGNTFNHWLEDHSLDPENWVPEMVRVYREHEPTLTPYPETAPLLEQLRRHYRLGIVTDGYLEVQRRKVKASGLAGLFDEIVYSDQLGRDAWKPSPRPFILILDKLTTAAHQAVYVGDNPLKDFRGARHVGMATIRVRHAAGFYRDVEPPTIDDAPDWTVSSLAEVLPLVERSGDDARVLMANTCPPTQSR